jgi:DNA invertase Pin-like site-specific DNA recombinase
VLLGYWFYERWFEPASVVRLETKRVSLRVLSISGNQPLDTSTSTGRLMLTVIGAVGQA